MEERSRQPSPLFLKRKGVAHRLLTPADAWHDCSWGFYLKRDRHQHEFYWYFTLWGWNVLSKHVNHNASHNTDFEHALWWIITKKPSTLSVLSHIALYITYDTKHRIYFSAFQTIRKMSESSAHWVIVFQIQQDMKNTDIIYTFLTAVSSFFTTLLKPSKTKGWVLSCIKMQGLICFVE